MGFIAACGVAVLAFFGFSGGWTALVVGVAAAILPVPVLVACFLWLDRYEPEPLKYLIFCFGWGAFVATGRRAGRQHQPAPASPTRPGCSDALVAVLVAPLIEERMKALGPDPAVLAPAPGVVRHHRRHRLLRTVRDRVRDGREHPVPGGQGLRRRRRPVRARHRAAPLVGIFIVPILMTGFAHPLFTSMTGVGLGIASRTAATAVRWLAPIAGLLLAMMLHGTWNLMSVTASGDRPRCCCTGTSP